MSYNGSKQSLLKARLLRGVEVGCCRFPGVVEVSIEVKSKLESKVKLVIPDS